MTTISAFCTARKSIMLTHTLINTSQCKGLENYFGSFLQNDIIELYNISTHYYNGS